MALQHAYAVTNLAASLAASAFTWSTGGTTNRAYLNDGRMDKRASPGAATSSLTLTIDLGTAVSVAAVALLNSNIAQAVSPTIAISAADDSGFSVGVVTPKSATTPNTTAPRNKDHALQFAAVSKRYWRLTWAWTGSFTLQLGEVFLASPTPLSRYTVYGHSERLELVTGRFRSDTGETRGHYVAGPYRQKTLPFEELTAAQRDELTAMFLATHGGAIPLLWLQQYEAVSAAAAADYQDVIWGRIEESGFSWAEKDFGLYTPDALVIRSLGREAGA